MSTKPPIGVSWLSLYKAVVTDPDAVPLGSDDTLKLNFPIHSGGQESYTIGEIKAKAFDEILPLLPETKEDAIKQFSEAKYALKAELPNIKNNSTLKLLEGIADLIRDLR